MTGIFCDGKLLSPFVYEIPYGQITPEVRVQEFNDPSHHFTPPRTHTLTHSNQALPKERECQIILNNCEVKSEEDGKTVRLKSSGEIRILHGARAWSSSDRRIFMMT